MNPATLSYEEQAQCCWALANSYLATASHLLDTHAADTFLPSLFLLLHALELHLKAFLISEGMSDRELRKIGHDLLACLRACNERGFTKHVALSWAEQIQIVRINVYYKEKELEYLTSKSMHFGSVERLVGTVNQVAKAVFNPITAKSFRLLSQEAN